MPRSQEASEAVEAPNIAPMNEDTHEVTEIERGPQFEDEENNAVIAADRFLGIYRLAQARIGPMSGDFWQRDEDPVGRGFR